MAGVLPLTQVCIIWHPVVLHVTMHITRRQPCFARAQPPHAPRSCARGGCGGALPPARVTPSFTQVLPSCTHFEVQFGNAIRSTLNLN